MLENDRWDSTRGWGLSRFGRVASTRCGLRSAEALGERRRSEWRQHGQFCRRPKRLCTQPRVLSQRSFSSTRGSSLFAPLHLALTVTVESRSCFCSCFAFYPHFPPLQLTPFFGYSGTSLDATVRHCLSVLSTTWTVSFGANNIHSVVLCQSEAKRGRLRLIHFLT